VIKKIVFIFLLFSPLNIDFPKVMARENEQFWRDIIRLRESKFGKDEKYLNKLSNCRMIADNFLKLKKEEGNFNKRVWAVSRCMKDYEAIMDVKKMIKNK
tara:strand:+ start:194 stop:493 length:300 start_codon:yes stop_codon:yes gene_type:complete